MSGIMVYTFDFYGWNKRTKGPLKGNWFKGTKKEANDAYQKQLLNQVKQLDQVIDKCKTFDYVDINNIYLLGSSMGGATVATCAITHSDDIRSIILQYPAINLNPKATVNDDELDVNHYTRNVLILQGNKDTIVPFKMTKSLLEHYNLYRKDHARMVVYDGESHVFTGKYKVIASKDIYEFIEEESLNK